MFKTFVSLLSGHASCYVPMTGKLRFNTTLASVSDRWMI